MRLAALKMLTVLMQAPTDQPCFYVDASDISQFIEVKKQALLVAHLNNTLLQTQFVS
jgi:hypothetical protein